MNLSGIARRGIESVKTIDVENPVPRNGELPIGNWIIGVLLKNSQPMKFASASMPKSQVMFHGARIFPPVTMTNAKPPSRALIAMSVRL